MRLRRPAQCVFCLVIAVAPGCQAFFPYRPMTVVACDAETKQPIADAHVHVSYPLVHASQSPYESSAISGADGLARVQAAPFGAAGVLVEVKARGYMLEQTTLSLEKVERLKPAGWFENVAERPADIVIELYAEPRPVVELHLPPGFRGMIKADVQIKSDAPCALGQRVFPYAVSPTGTVKVVGPPLVDRVVPLDYQAVAHDGTRLRNDAQGLDIGFYAVKSDSRSVTFFVGTRREFESLRRAELQNDNGSNRSRPSGGGGGGRRGGRHGSQSSDASTSGQ